jgi:hypothetical protein
MLCCIHNHFITSLIIFMWDACDGGMMVVELKTDLCDGNLTMQVMKGGNLVSQ